MCSSYTQLTKDGQQCGLCTLKITKGVEGRYKIDLKTTVSVFTKSFVVIASGRLDINTRKEQPQPEIKSVLGCRLNSPTTEVRGCRVGDVITLHGKLLQSSQYYLAPMTSVQTQRTSANLRVCACLSPKLRDFRHPIPFLKVRIIDLISIDCTTPTKLAQPLHAGCWSTASVKSISPFMRSRPRFIFLRGNGTEACCPAFYGNLEVTHTGMQVAQRLMFKKSCSDNTPCGMFCGPELKADSTIQIESHYSSVRLNTSRAGLHVCMSPYRLTHILWLNRIFQATKWRISLDGSGPMHVASKGAAVKTTECQPLR